MKKALKVVSIVVGLVVICIGWFIYIAEYQHDLRGTEISPDGQYSILFYAVGEPDWPFGETPVKVIVKNNNSRRRIETIKTAICDDGATLSEYNWSVEWNSDAVVITLRGSEQADVLYEVPLRQSD